MFSKGLCWSIGTIKRKDTWKLSYHGRHFCFEMDKVLRINYWPLKSAFYIFTGIICPASGSNSLKFISDSPLVFFSDFLIEKSKFAVMGSDGMPNEMNNSVK